MKTILIIALLKLTAFSWAMTAPSGKHPTIKHTVVQIAVDSSYTQTQLLLDKYTSREDVIHACSLLAEENVQLTFEVLEIRRPFIGLLGKYRIGYVKGTIQLPGGNTEKFQGGGKLAPFKSIKITFSKNTQTQHYYFNMVEIID